ncbi:MAG: AbrB/MazE/SpoVT family DNA-binding domain-containing protein [Timaviella obliquedivisa GSE-PSE-MK23-08B]|jgi:antitoxin MazE|nr:AbrB/MazE/SpoVT family DNA-binding domain-containing protein [Timaviella obliquedivisa GSE-PSE-MK23-08B]
MEKQSRSRNVRLIQIGNSKGVRLPKAILQKYGFADALLLEETEHGILLRNRDNLKLSWEETYKAIAAEQEDWADFDDALADGLDPDEFDT